MKTPVQEDSPQVLKCSSPPPLLYECPLGNEQPPCSRLPSEHPVLPYFLGCLICISGKLACDLGLFCPRPSAATLRDSCESQLLSLNVHQSLIQKHSLTTHFMPRIYRVLEYQWPLPSELPVEEGCLHSPAQPHSTPTDHFTGTGSENEPGASIQIQKGWLSQVTTNQTCDLADSQDREE